MQKSSENVLVSPK